jgi:hypothetical protein
MVGARHAVPPRRLFASRLWDLFEQPATNALQIRSEGVKRNPGNHHPGSRHASSELHPKPFKEACHESIADALLELSREKPR